MNGLLTVTVNPMKFDQLINQAPCPENRDDTWARLCCELAISAHEQGNYAVGALLTNADDELLCTAANSVFSCGYHSDRHAEMVLLNQLEENLPTQNRLELTLYVSLEPCLMCYGRILLSGIQRVRYLAKDPDGGFADHLHLLPPAWRNLASRVTVEPMQANDYWKTLAAKLISELQHRDEMRQQVKNAWAGK